jgi:drug/metabolite transporter (DMT)-like permease
VLLAWGVQSYVIRLAHASMSAESIFFYMTVSGLLCIPAALALTDWSAPINFGWSGPGLSALVQLLNAVGALTLVYAFRDGKAIVVAPMVNAGAPLLTAVIAMAGAGVLPGAAKLAGIALALLAALLLALPDEAAAGVNGPAELAD